MQSNEVKWLPLKCLQPNTGQVPGLPGNPRQWTEGDIKRIARSLKETPELFAARPIIVLPYSVPGADDCYVILGGNLRSEGARRNKMVTVPCYILPSETPVDKLKEIVIKDNGSFGAWDYDALGNEWSDLPLPEWGVPAWDVEHIGDGEGDGGKESKPEKAAAEEDPKVEAMLNDAMRDNVREALSQIDCGMRNGFLSTFLTEGLTRAKFIRAKYYGEHYPQWLSLYFCPERLYTSANKKSPYTQMRLIADGKTDAGIAGLRTLTSDGLLLLLLLLKGSYPFGAARMPMDFPANTARSLIEEFAGAGAAILDPCHGWGGRLCGAMMADVGLYVGVDPSPEAHAGVEREYAAFSQYCAGTSAEFIMAPYEDADLGDRIFDMAITSPPYFDVEQYHGEGQAHERYPKYGAWVDGFYRPLILKTYAHLKADGVFILQVGSQTYPLLEDGKRLAAAAGFVVEDVRPLGGGTNSALHGNDDEDADNEKIIVLRKK